MHHIAIKDQQPGSRNPPSVIPQLRNEPREPSRTPLGFRPLLNLAIIAVTLVFSYVALSSINLSLAWHALRTSDYSWLAIALIAFSLGNLTRAFRWRSLFAPDRRPPIGSVWNAMMVGYLYNNIMPARAGEAARVVVLTQRSAAPATEIVGTVVIERLYDVIAILLIFFAAKSWLPPVSWFDAAAIAALVLAISIIIGAAVLAIYGDRPLRILLRPLRRLSLFSGERFDRTIDELVLWAQWIAPSPHCIGSLPLDNRSMAVYFPLRLFRECLLSPASTVGMRSTRRSRYRSRDDPSVPSSSYRGIRGSRSDRTRCIRHSTLFRTPVRRCSSSRQLRALYCRRPTHTPLQFSPSHKLRG